MLENVAAPTPPAVLLPAPMAMVIQVIGEDESSDSQVRAYAEYRVFRVLAPHSQRVRGARVVLRRVACEGASHAAVCAVTVALEPSGSVRTRARGRHPYAAIDGAVERVDGLIRRHMAERLSS
jgi:ribosome-associated translation inhibitor RaiA